jgi:CheY-like chemotaxis protein
MVVGPVDLVITDIALPWMDGCALAASLRDRWPEIPVLAISGYFVDRDVQEFEFDGFLDKPINLQELRAAVTGLLHSDN